MMPGETVASGAPTTCPDCHEHVNGPKVMCSAAGHYIGYTCDCGPYSRESDYYPSEKAAEAALAKGDFGRWP